MVDFGTTLKTLRQQAGMTQKQLAERLWLSKSMVSYYEQSLRYPSPEILVRISGIFHVTTDFLLGIEEKKQTIDVTGLTDEDIQFIQNSIDFIRQKNYEKENIKRKNHDREE